jgi:DNA repair exonuclease SbcCD ATPase subunit
MKRLVALVLCLLAGSHLQSRAADTWSDAAVLAAQRDSEERYKRLSAEMQALAETQEVIIKRQEDFRQRLDKLADDIRSAKEEHSRSAGNLATREDLRKYAEKLKELDEKRESDKKLILENIKELAKVPMAPPPETKPAPRHAPDPNEEPPLVYTVRKNDRLLDILAAYNEHFQKNGQAKITMAQVLKANPGLKADRLVAGTKVKIPFPPKDSKDSK